MILETACAAISIASAAAILILTRRQEARVARIRRETDMASLAICGFAAQLAAQVRRRRQIEPTTLSDLILAVRVRDAVMTGGYPTFEDAARAVELGTRAQVALIHAAVPPSNPSNN